MYSFFFQNVLKDIRQSQEKKAMKDTNQIIIDKQPKVVSNMEVPKKDITKTIMTMIVFEL